MKIVKMIGVFWLCMLHFYLFGAFIGSSFDISTWDLLAKVWGTLFSVFVSAVFTGAMFDTTGTE
jgi:predicted membrane protein